MPLDDSDIFEKKRILVVDDLASDSRLLKLYLEGTDRYVVREENDPRAAVATAEEFAPDLILLDVEMPEMSGAAVAAGIEASQKLRAVPVIFLTATITKGEVAAVDGWIGKYPFIAKPIVLAEVATCLKHHLGE